jgi:predicted amidophosphoribosyltransferase
MAALVAPTTANGGLDLVTWAPTSAERRRERGFDQAELLARAVGRRLRLPVKGLLERRPGAPQTGRNATDRHLGPRFTTKPSPPAVLLVDDVVTTGATLAAAASALRLGGANRVLAVTAGRTPLKILQPTADA